MSTQVTLVQTFDGIYWDRNIYFSRFIDGPGNTPFVFVFKKKEFIEKSLTNLPFSCFFGSIKKFAKKEIVSASTLVAKLTRTITSLMAIVMVWIVTSIMDNVLCIMLDVYWLIT